MAQSNNDNSNHELEGNGILSKISLSDFDTLFEEGNDLLGEGKYEEAISIYDKALVIDPNHVPTLSNKGFALLNLGLNQEALEYFDKALAIDPNNADILHKSPMMPNH